MIRIGAVNIDTSHPLGFAEVMEKSDRAKYVGVYNDSFRNDEEVEGFIKRFGLEKRCESIEELADMCDIGFIHGCNWDEHISCMMPFIQRGKPVFVDKPIVGSLKECEKLQELINNGAVILGASSVRYCYELQALLNMPIEERGEIVTVFGTVGVDEFNYGIHIAEAIGGILGQGAQHVKYIGKGQADGKYSESYFVSFENGKSAIFNTFTGTWQPFVITVMTTKTTHHFKIDSSKLYEALLHEICNYLEHKPNLMATPQALLESIKIMLAAAQSRKNNGEAVLLSQLEEDVSYDGTLFYNEYSAASGKMYAL